MYCSQCEAYIPGGLNLTRCPSCEVDILTAAPPIERKRPVILETPAPPPTPKIKIREKIKPETDFNVFQALIYSFFSPSLYVDVARKWKGACLVYMTILSAVAGLPMAASFATQYGEVQDEHIMPVLGRFPGMKIENEKLTIVEPSPYTLRDAKNQITLGVFDTSGQVTSLNQMPAAFLFAKDFMTYRDGNSGSENQIKYAPHLKIKVDNQILFYGAHQLERWMSFLTFPIMCCAVTLIFLVLGFLYSLPGMVYSMIWKTHLDYGAVYRLAVVAMTPATVFSGLLTLMVQDLDERMTFFYLLPLGYLAFGVFSLRRQTKREAQEKLALETAQKGKRAIFS
jgi:hypothetical protein